MNSYNERPHNKQTFGPMCPLLSLTCSDGARALCERDTCAWFVRPAKCCVLQFTTGIKCNLDVISRCIEDGL